MQPAKGQGTERDPEERELGFVDNSVPQEFFDPLPEEELTSWE